MLGQIIGSYRIVAELGRGGMGVVYRAEHIQLGRPAALKVLLPQMSGDAQIVQRFWNEARAASSIDHPGIVEVYDFGRHTDGSAYLVMELLKGESLDHRLMRPLPPLEAASLIAQVAGALSAAHARGIVHRDLKPDNIYLVPNELLPGGIQVKLLDFGIAKLADERAAGFRTQTGVLIGTPAYMSPEQCMGSPDLDHRTDLYSVGCILFHMLCGRPPFYSEQGTGVMIAMHLRDPVPDPRTFAPHLPEALVGIMLRLLEKDPAARFQSAQELRRALVAAGAVAPMTAPGAGAGPDVYGATMASGPPPARGAAGPGRAEPGRAGPPSMPGPMGPMGSMSGPTLGMGPGPATGLGPATGPGGYAGGYGPAPAMELGGYAGGYGPTAALGPVSAMGPTPTTHSGAAAEQMTRRDRTGGRGQAAPGGGRAAWIVVGALLVAGGGIGVGVAMTSHEDDPLPAKPAGSGESPATLAALGSGSGHEATLAALGSGSGREATPPGAGSGSQEARPRVPVQIPPELPPDTSGGPPCPAGQLRTDDTRGECCWAGQAWSSPKKRCIGAPTCPPGTRARGEACLAVAEANPARAGTQIAADDPLAAAPELQLAASSFTAGAAIEIRLSRAIRSATGRQAWVTVAPAGSPQTAYGTWKFVEDGARRASLAAPSKAGAYEIRLHTDYPAKSFNVVRAVPFAVAALATPDATPDQTPDPTAHQAAQTGATPPSGQRFSLGSKAVRAGEKVAVRFPGPLRAATGERFWITVIEAGASDTSWGKWEYVTDGARSMALGVPDKEGAYEVRLHGNYPKKSTNVVYRSAFHVDAD